jgi:uncharacterized protein (TIGR00369 family)
MPDRSIAKSPDEIIAEIPLLHFLGMRAVAGPDGTYCVEMDVTPAVVNLAGNPHGGAVAALIDHCGGFACGALLGRSGPTVDMHIRYLTTPKSGLLRSTARIIRAGRTLIIVAVDVDDGAGRLCATGTISVAPFARTGVTPPD